VDTVISVFSSTSIAAGLIILARGGKFARYSTLLIGDILAVTPQDLLFLTLALPVGVLLWALMYNPLLMTSVSPSLARSRGIRTRLVECAFVVLVAVAVMLAIRWVGVLLINDQPILVLEGGMRDPAPICARIRPVLDAHPRNQQIRFIEFYEKPLPRTASGKIMRWAIQREREGL
jgi:hypothetical protein